MEFKQEWDIDINYLVNPSDKSTITVCDYSKKLGYICIGGVEGSIFLFD